MNQGYAGANLMPDKPREATINERLNRVSERLQIVCERLETVLARVNGNPAVKAQEGSRVAQIMPTLPMVTVVEHLEGSRNRLEELTGRVESIA